MDSNQSEVGRATLTVRHASDALKQVRGMADKIHTVAQIVSDPEIKLEITMRLSEWRTFEEQIASIPGAPTWWIRNVVEQHTRFFRDRSEGRWKCDPWSHRHDPLPDQAPKEPAA